MEAARLIKEQESEQLGRDQRLADRRSDRRGSQGGVMALTMRPTERLSDGLYTVVVGGG